MGRDARKMADAPGLSAHPCSLILLLSRPTQLEVTGMPDDCQKAETDVYYNTGRMKLGLRWAAVHAVP